MNYTIENNITVEMIDKVKNYVVFNKSRVIVPDVLKRRLKKETLRSIGKIYGVTQSRIMQHEAWGVMVVKMKNEN